MSLHPSLKVDKAGAQIRTVMTRIERIKDMMKKGLWNDESLPIGMPKVKIVRVKTKKRVKKEDEKAAGGKEEKAKGKK